MYIYFSKKNLLCKQFDDKNRISILKATKVTLSDFEKYDIVISASPLYLGPDDEFINAAHLTDRIYKRLSWKRLVYCLCREAANHSIAD